MRCHSACRVPLLWCTILLHILVGQASTESGAQQSPAAVPQQPGLVLRDEEADSFEYGGVEDEVSEGHPEQLAGSPPEYAGAWIEANHVKTE